jgi:hypothetical protein
MYTRRLGGLLTWVDEHVFAAGGDHVPATWSDFSAQTGVTAVVHLRRHSPAVFCGPPAEAFLWLGVEQEAEADQALLRLAGTFMVEMLAMGRRVLIHSSAGRHRTRWVYVAHLICSGRTVPRALQAAEARPWLAPYTTRSEMWEAFALSVRGSPVAEAGQAV